MNKEQINKLLAKLRTPVHIEYIAKYILESSIDETKKELNMLLEEGVIEESKYAKEYYVIKNQNEDRAS
jgi:hypothetical protein